MAEVFNQNDGESDRGPEELGIEISETAQRFTRAIGRIPFLRQQFLKQMAELELVDAEIVASYVTPTMQEQDGEDEVLRGVGLVSVIRTKNARIGGITPIIFYPHPPIPITYTKPDEIEPSSLRLRPIEDLILNSMDRSMGYAERIIKASRESDQIVSDWYQAIGQYRAFGALAARQELAMSSLSVYNVGPLARDSQN